LNKRLISNVSEEQALKIVYCYFFELTGVQEAEKIKKFVEFTKSVKKE
jgi:hypothetical protein